MTRPILLALVCLPLSLALFAQGQPAAPPPPLEPGAAQADVDKALLPAPANQRAQATVIKWKPDFTYETLRKGTNRLVCYDRSGFAQQQPFSVQCTSVANIDRVAQNLKAEAAGDRKQSEALLTGYRASAAATEAEAAMHTKVWETQIKDYEASQQIAIQQAKMNADTVVATNNARLDAAKVGAQVYAQLTASAYGMIHASAGISASGGSSVSYSYSGDVSSEVSPITLI